MTVTRSPVRSIAALLLGASSLTACAVGPNYRPPETSASVAAPFIGGATPGVTTAAVPGDWWKLYDDPVLNGLVADALTANADIRVAIAHLEKARAQLRGARSDALPQTSLGASEQYGRSARVATLPGLDTQRWTLDQGLSVSYEVDLFGRVKREIEAAHGDVAAATADVDAVRVAVVADTVRAYVDAAATAQQIAVAKETVDLLDKSVRITTARFNAGRSERLDVIRVTALRDQQKAEIPNLEAARDSALFRLATLTARAPRDLPVEAGTRTQPPVLNQPIPVGDGRALLARRPDVRAAEQRLAADTARIGVAVADLYPRINLGGAVGTTAVGGAPLFGANAFRWLVGPLINWGFPNQEGPRARIKAAKADSAAALATFDGTVLTALQETETALSAYQGATRRQQELTATRDESARAAKIVEARQREGRTDFLTVLDAQRTLASSRAALADATHAVSLAQVDLFRALGGGWQASETATADAGRPQSLASR